MSETNETHETNPSLKEAREHMRAARKAMRMTLDEMLPKGYVERRREVRKEFLLAMRSLLDAAIDKTEK